MDLLRQDLLQINAKFLDLYRQLEETEDLLMMKTIHLFHKKKDSIGLGEKLVEEERGPWTV